MKTINPISRGANYTAKGVFAPTVANFPCVKFWLKCTETSTAQIADAISGKLRASVSDVTGDGTKLTVAASGTFSFSGLTGIPAVSGNRNAVHFAVFNITSGGDTSMAFSGAASSAFTLASTASNFSDGTNSVAPGAITTAALTGAAGIYTPGTSNEGLRIEGNLTTVFPTGTPASATPGDLDDLPALTSLSVTQIVQPMDLYGEAIFHFSAGVPDNLRAGLAWMTAQWSDNIDALPVATYGKLIYPGWKGLAA